MSNQGLVRRSKSLANLGKVIDMYMPRQNLIILSVLVSMFIFSCTPQGEGSISVTPVEVQTEAPVSVDAEFTLKTIAEKGKMLYQGVGGEIDGVINPDLVVSPGAVVRILLINDDNMTHNLFLPDFDAKTGYVRNFGDISEVIFRVGDNVQPGSYVYYCQLPGHRKAGQEGKLIVEEK